MASDTGSGNSSVTGNVNTFTIALLPSGVTAGNYTMSSLVVDQYGRVTSASSGSIAQSLTVTGDATGSVAISSASGSYTMPLTLAPVGTAGSYNFVVTDSAGRVVSGANVAYLKANQPVTISGDASGFGTTSIPLTLANVTTAGTFAQIIVNAKGLVIGGLNPLTTVQLSGDALGGGAAVTGGTASISVSLAAVGTPGTYNTVITDAQGRVVSGMSGPPMFSQSISPTITVSGDASGSGTTAIALTLASVGTAGTYIKVVVDAAGRVIGSVAPGLADVVQALGYTPLSTAMTGVPYGVATLDSGGHLTMAQIPAGLTGGISFRGTWDANANQPPLTSGVGTQGDLYRVGVAGGATLDGITPWNVGDDALYDGTSWRKLDGIATEVLSVAGRTGAVTITIADVSGAAPLASPVFTGVPSAPTAASGDSSAALATTAFVKAQGYLAANQPISITGDVSGSGATSILLTLAATGTPGTYNSIVTDVQGRVVAGTYVPSPPAPGPQSISISGDASGSGTTAIALTLASVGISGTYTQVVTDTKGRVTSATYVPFLSANQPITLAGDATGSGTTAISVSLAAVGTAGTYTKVVTDAKGRVIFATYVPYLIGNQSLAITGDASGSGSTAISLLLATVGLPGTYNSVVTDAKGRVTAGTSIAYLTANQTVAVSGDASGAGTTAIALTLAALGTAGTYNSVVTDAKGRVASGTFVPYLSGNQIIVVSGDAMGSGSTAIALTLAPVGVPGTYNSVVTDTKGRITYGTSVAFLTANQPVAVSGDVSGAGTTAIVLTLAAVGTAGTYTQVVTDAKGRVTSASYVPFLLSNQTISVTGDASGTGSTAISLVLASTGTAGTYNLVTTDAKGRVVAGTAVPYLTANQQVTVSGDAVGVGSTAISLTLVAVGTPGTYTQVVTDIRGRVTSATYIPFLTTNQPVAVTGDVTGTGSTAIVLTLAAVGAAGTYNSITTDAKGRVVAGTSISYLTANQPVAISGDATGSGSTAISLTLAASGVTPGTYSVLAVDAKGRATVGSNPQTTLALTGDAAASGSFLLGGTATLSLVLAATGAPGTYNSVTTDAKGRVVAGTSIAYLTANQPVTVTGDATGTGSTAIVLALAASGVVAGTYSVLAVDAKGRATSGSNPQTTLALTGDATATGSFLLGATASLALALAPVGTPGSYNFVTTDAKGRVVAGSSIAYLTTNQTVTITGDATGAGSTAIALTLAASGVVAGTYSVLAVDAKGRAISGSNPSTSITATGDATATATFLLGGAATLALALAAVGSVGTFNSVVTDTKGRITAGTSLPYLLANQTITVSGDATGTGSSAIALTLAASGVTAGTYDKVVVDAKGRVTRGTFLVPADITTALGYVPVSTAIVGQPSGLATLDTNGTLTLAQVPASIVGGINYQGIWDASANNPMLASGVGTKGYLYRVGTAGSTTLDGISQWNVGDDAVFDGSVWSKLDGIASEVLSVAGRTGVVVLAVADVTGAAPLNSPAFTGTPTAPTVSLSDNSNALATTAFVKGQNYGYGSATGSGANGVVTLTGDVTGMGTTAIAVTLTSVGTAGTYTQVVTDTKGRVVSASYVPFLSSNQSITIVGDASGSGATSINLTLADTGVGGGTYSTVVSDSKGRITSGANPSSTVTLTGDATGTGSSVVGGTAYVALTLASLGTAGTYNMVTIDAKGRVVAGSSVAYLTSNQSVSITGDAIGTGSTAIVLTLATTGVAAGTYDKVTVDAKGRVLAGANPTTTLTASGDVSGTTGFLNGSSTSLSLVLAPVGTLGTYNLVTTDAKGRVVSGSNAAYLLSNQTISVTGDASGTGSTAIAMTLASVGTAGTYVKVIVDAKGRVTGSTALLLSDVTTALGYTPVNNALVGAPSGLATLDGTGHLTMAQIPQSVVGGINYQGTWDASTNSPTLTSSTGTKGFLYRVSIAGSTNLDGITQWNVGDDAVFDGSVWSKFDGIASEVLSVAGRTGAVVLATADVSGAAALASPAFTGTPTAPTPSTGDSSTTLSTTAFVKAQGYLSGNQSIAISGDASGIGSTAIALTLTSVGNMGTYNLVTTDAKGRVIAGSSIAYLTTNQPVTITGDATGSGSTAIALTLAATGVTLGTYSTVSVDAKGRVLAGTNPTTTLTASGDAIGSTAFLTGSSTTLALALASVGTPGTYTQVVVDAKGRATSGFNPSSSVVASGDATGTASFLVGGAAALALTLAASGVAAGTYANATVTVDAKGRVTAAAAGTPMTVTALAPLAASSSLGNTTLSLSSSGVVAGTYSLATIVLDIYGRATSATAGSIAETISATGDATGSVSVTSTGGSYVLPLVLAPVGTAGSYSSVTTDAKGRVTAGTNPTSTISVSGDASGSAGFLVGGTAGLVLALASVNVAGTYNFVTTDAKGRVTAGTSIAYLTANQTVTVTGDATGVGNTAIALTLASTGVVAGTYSVLAVDAKGRVLSASSPYTSASISGDATSTGSFLLGGSLSLGLALAAVGTAGTYTQVVTDAKGRITSGSLVAFLTANQPVTISGDASGIGSTAIALTLASTGVVAGTYASVSVDAKGRVLAGTNPTTTLTASGDVSGSTSFLEGSSSTVALSLAAVGTAGTYSQVITDAKGRVAAGSNPATALSLTGDATAAGSFVVGGSLALPLVLASVGTPGTYNSVVTDAKGRVVTGSSVAYLTTNQTVVVSGDATGTGSTAITLTLAASGVVAGTYTQVAVDAKGRTTSGSNPSSSVVLSGDASGSASFLVGGTAAISFALAASGVTAGSYANASISVDAKGRITSATANPAVSIAASAPLSVSSTQGAYTISLSPSGVTAGTYALATVVLDTYGRATSASAGSVAETITASGDATGTVSITSTAGSYALPLTLALVGTPGTFTSVITDAKGRVASGSNPSSTVALSGDATGSASYLVGGTASVALTLASVNVAGTYNLVTTDAKGRVVAGTSLPYLVANQTVTITGDATGTGSTAIALTLAATGVAAGTYNSVVADTKGRILSGTSLPVLLANTVIGVAGVSATGAISTTSVVLSPSITASNWQNQGAIIGWNYSAANGETDLFSSHGGGSGGFNFYNTASSASAVPVLLAAINGAGSFNAVAINGTPIGGTTPAAGYFTTLQSSGTAVLTSLAATGDVSGNSSGGNIALLLAQVGTAGTYTQVTTDAKGRVTLGANPASTLSISGDATATGSFVVGGSLALPLVLASVGTAGTYNSVVTDTKGRVVSGVANAYLSANQTITVSGDVSGTGSTAIALTLAASGVTVGTYTQVVVDAKGRATAGANPSSSVVASGDATGTASFLVGGTAAIALTLAASGVAAGTYANASVTVDAKGRVTAATANPTISVSATAPLSATSTLGAYTIALSPSGVTAGTYALATVVIDTFGRATSASAGAVSETITASGDATGSVSITAASGSFGLPLTLASVGTAGTYIKVIIDAKGRVTGSLALASADVTTALGYTPVSTAVVGVASGLATLDGTGHLTMGQIPQSLVGGINFQGTWNASTNSPTLTSSTGTKGYLYRVSTAGSTNLDGISQWNVGDDAVFDGSVWSKFDGIASEVLSVAGRTGVVVLAVADVSGAAPLASPAFTGTPTAPTPAISDSSTTVATTAYVKGQGYATGNQTISISGDASGSGTTAIVLTLASTGVVAGTYSTVAVDAKGRVLTAANPSTTIAATGDATATASVVVGGTATLALVLAAVNTAGTYNLVTTDAKGRVIAGSSVAYLTANQNVAITGDATGTGSTAIALTLAASGVAAGTYTQVVVDAKGRATNGINPSSSVVASGDATGSASFLVGGTASIALTLASSGVTAGTYANASITVDAKGRVLSAVANTPVSVTATAPLAASSTLGVTTVSLSPSGVTAGTYALATVVVDTYGRATSAIAGTIAEVIAATGDATGSVSISATSGTFGLPLTLAAVGTAGTYNSVVTDAKGRVISGVTNAYLTTNQTVTVSGDASGSGTTSIALTLASTGVLAGTYSTVTVDAKGRVLTATNPSTTITATGDATATATVIVGGTATLPLVLAPVGTVGTYSTVVTDAKGRVTIGSNPSSTVTLSGDASGSGSHLVGGTATVAVTLASVNTAGTYNVVTTDAKGRVIAGSSVAYLTANQTVTVTGDATGTGSTAIALTLGASGVAAGTYANASITVDAKGRVIAAVAGTASSVAATAPLAASSSLGVTTLSLSASGVTAGTYTLATVVLDAFGRATSANAGTVAETITATGDATGTVNVTGTSGTFSLPLTLASVGTAGTYVKVIVDAKGRVTGNLALSSTDVTTALGYTPATLASPAFTGAPTAPTAAQFDTTTKLATTAWVQAQGHSFNAWTNYTASGTIPLVQIGGFILIPLANTAAITLTLPLANSVNAGSTITISNAATYTSTVALQGTDSFGISTTISMQQYDKAAFVSDGSGFWRVTDYTNYALGSQKVLNNLTVGGNASIAGTVIVPTVTTGDNSNTAATTAFVKAQNYLPANTVIGVAGVSSSGQISTTNVVLTGTISSSQWQNQGVILGWNYSNGGGESDLMNSQGGGGGGFNFYNTQSTATAVPVLLVAISGGGSITANGGINSTPIGNNSTSSGNFTSLTSNGTNVLTSLAATGDATGTSSGSSIALTLASVMTAGTYTKVVADAKGRITGSGTLAVADVSGAAPLASPALTGTPTAPTPATLDNSTKIATTAWVDAKGEAFSTNAYKYTASTTLTATTVGALIMVTPTAAATMTLPLSSTLLVGSTINVQNTSAYAVSFAIQSPDTLDDTTAIALNDTVTFAVIASGSWKMIQRNLVHQNSLTVPANLTVTGTATVQTLASTYNNTQVASMGAVQAVTSAKTPPGFRNCILNGNFTVNQRGVSATNTVGGGAFFSDRWRYSNVNGGSRTYGVVAATDAVRLALADEAVTYIATATFAGTSTSGDCEIMYQCTEDVRRFAGKTVIVSGWAYNTGSTALSFATELTQNFGTGGSPSAEVDSNGSTLFSVPATTWTRFVTAPITLPTAQGKTVGTNGDSIMQLIIWLSAAGTSNVARAANLGVQSGTLQFANIQVEQTLPGVTGATPFEYRPPEVELIICRRYYQGTKQHILSGYTTASSTVSICAHFAPTMRATPTISTTVLANTNLSTMTASILPGDTICFTGTATATGVTAFSETFTLTADL